MIARYLAPCLCALTLLFTGSANAVDVNTCWMVAKGRAEVITFDAEMAKGRHVKLKGLFSSPNGTGPFAAIVILPGSTGLFTPFCYGAVVEQFLSWGFVTLVVAPTTARDRTANQVFQYSFADLGNYSRGAGSALADLPQVDPARLGLWGHSRGGLAVIDAISNADNRQIAFRAAIAAAPNCPAKAVPPRIPLLVMIGTEDDQSPVKWCIDHAAQLEDVSEFEFLLLPDAGHAYWAPEARKYNGKAAKLAERRLKAFLGNL